MAKSKAIRESPERLRQCLEALSEACGHDVFRLELKALADGNIRLILTCSRKTSERTVAELLAAELKRSSGITTFKDTEEQGAIDGEDP